MIKRIDIRAIAVTGVMAALGTVLMYLEFPIAFLIPSFIKFDFSELPALITAFAFGPLYGISVCLVKNLLHAMVSQSFGVGEISNFILGAVFCGIAGLIYQRKRTRKGALLGAAIGALVMAAISFPSNLLVVYPIYENFMPREVIVGMYETLLPAADQLWKALLIFNVPFTFAKGAIDALICFLIYKPLSPILKGTGRFARNQRVSDGKA